MYKVQFGDNGHDVSRKRRRGDSRHVGCAEPTAGDYQHAIRRKHAGKNEPKHVEFGSFKRLKLVSFTISEPPGHYDVNVRQREVDLH